MHCLSSRRSETPKLCSVRVECVNYRSAKSTSVSQAPNYFFSPRTNERLGRRHEFYQTSVPLTSRDRMFDSGSTCHRHLIQRTECCHAFWVSYFDGCQVGSNQCYLSKKPCLTKLPHLPENSFWVLKAHGVVSLLKIETAVRLMPKHEFFSPHADFFCSHAKRKKKFHKPHQMYPARSRICSAPAENSSHALRFICIFAFILSEPSCCANQRLNNSCAFVIYPNWAYLSCVCVWIHFTPSFGWYHYWDLWFWIHLEILNWNDVPHSVEITDVVVGVLCCRAVCSHENLKYWSCITTFLSAHASHEDWHRAFALVMIK